MGLRGTCWATALELVHFAKWTNSSISTWISWTCLNFMDNFCAHFANLGGPNVLTERSFRFLILGETAAKPWKPGFDLSGCQLQPTHNLYSPCCCIGSDAKAEFRALPWRLMQAPQTFWFYFLFCMFRMMGSVFGGTLPFLHFFEQCCAVLSVSPNWSHGSPKKILGSRPSATFMSWNKYVSHQMRCSEVSVSKVLLTSCRFWASFRAWPGIQLRHEMLTHAYSNSPLTVRKNVFIRSWMNFMNCEWQSHLPQFKLDRSVWLSCTSIERQKHTHKTAAQICRAVFGSLDFAGPLQGNTTIWCNLSLEKKTINNTCD